MDLNDRSTTYFSRFQYIEWDAAGQVYEEWITGRESYGFKDNSSFARFLLERAKLSGTAATTSAVSESLPK